MKLHNLVGISEDLFDMEGSTPEVTRAHQKPLSLHSSPVHTVGESIVSAQPLTTG